jgi:hypothetical protein
MGVERAVTEVGLDGSRELDVLALGVGERLAVGLEELAVPVAGEPVRVVGDGTDQQHVEFVAGVVAGPHHREQFGHPLVADGVANREHVPATGTSIGRKRAGVKSRLHSGIRRTSASSRDSTVPGQARWTSTYGVSPTDSWYRPHCIPMTYRSPRRAATRVARRGSTAAPCG